MCASASSLVDNNWFNPSTKMRVTAEGNLQFSALFLQSSVTFYLSFLTFIFFVPWFFPFVLHKWRTEMSTGISRNETIVGVIHLKKTNNIKSVNFPDLTLLYLSFKSKITYFFIIHITAVGSSLTEICESCFPGGGEYKVRMSSRINIATFMGKYHVIFL